MLNRESLDMKQLLSELYESEPSLKKDEVKLVEALEFLMRAKPNSKLDAGFKRQLRARLDTQIDVKKHAIKKPASSYFTNIRFWFPFMGGMAFAAAFGAFLWPQMLMNQK